MKKYWYLIFLAQLFSCDVSEPEAAIEFDTPQPENVRNEKSFRPQFIKSYFHTQDSSDVLVIGRKGIFRIQQMNLMISASEVDSSEEIRLTRDKLFLSEDDEDGLPYFMKNDTIHITHKRIDTVFFISDKQVLRSYKGNYYLNYLQNDGFWQVKKVELNKGNLRISSLNTGMDFNKLKKATEIREIKDEQGKVIDFVAHPSKKEFKKFIDHGGFGEEVTYQVIIINQ